MDNEQQRLPTDEEWLNLSDDERWEWVARAQRVRGMSEHDIEWRNQFVRERQLTMPVSSREAMVAIFWEVSWETIKQTLATMAA